MTYAIKMTKAGVGLANKIVGEANHEGPVLLSARPGVKYVLTQMWDSSSDHKGAPKKLVTQRAGNDLHIAIDAQDAAFPDIVIQGYFLYAPAPLTGVGPTGDAFDYGALDTKASWGGAMTADAAIGAAGTAPTYLSDTSTLPSGPFASLGTVGQLGLAGGGLLLLGAVGHESGGGSPASSAGDPAALAAQALVNAYAKNGAAKAPAVGDYVALGVTGVTTANLASVNNAVDTLPEASVASKAQVQAVVDGWVHLLAAAKSSTSAWVASASDPTVSDLLAIGASIGVAGKDGVAGHATDAQHGAALGLLDSSIARLASTAVDSVQKVNDLYKVVDKLMQLAQGVDPTDALTKDDLLGLGVSGATVDNLSVILDGIKASSDDGSAIASVKQLQAVVSQYVMVAYADQDSNPAPTQQDYLNIGVTSRVDSSNLSAINDAIRVLDKSSVDTLPEVQGVVDAYRKILGDAQGASDSSARQSTTDPTLSDFRTIGVTAGKAVTAGDTQQAAALNLLDDVLIRKTSSSVNTVDEINALVKVIDKVMTLAAGADPAIALTASELSTLGISNVGPDNLTAIQQQIKASADDGTGVDTVQELQAAVSLGTILGYSNNSNSSTAPTLLDYSNIGIHNTGVSSANLGAINSVIHGLAQANVDTVAEINGVITAWDHILSEANGSAVDVLPTPLASDYALIGIGPGTMLANTAVGTNTSTSTLGADALALLNNAIGLKQRTDLTSLNALTDLEHIVEKVMNQANVLNDPTATSFTNVGGLLSQDLTRLGVVLSSNVNESNPAKWNKFISLVSNATIDDVNTIDKLQALASSQAVLTA